jgi:nitroreductase
MKSLVLAVLLFCVSSNFVSAQDMKQQTLPDPRTTGGKPLRDVLGDRQTNRDFKPDMITNQELSDLLWAAWGINRQDIGKRTAPSWKNFQEIGIYVATKDGVRQWDEKRNVLDPVSDVDVRGLTQNKSFVTVVPLMLLYIADYDKMDAPKKDKRFISGTDSGFISQNVYLHCASEGLSTVVMGAIDRKKMRKALKLKRNLHIIHCQAVGYPAQ